MSTADLFGKLYEDFYFDDDTIDKSIMFFFLHPGAQKQSKSN